MKRYIQLLTKQPGVARDELLGHQLAEPLKIELCDPNEKRAGWTGWMT